MNWLSDLGVAKFLQDADYDVYGIIDINNKTRKTFKEQEIIKFSKSWYFQEHMLDISKKPDIKFLQEFEKKYQINLWLLLYKDRNFIHYNEYYDYSSDELLSIAENVIRFFEKILDEVKPSFIYMHTPDYFHIELLNELCKAKEIKVLTLSSTRFENRYMISETTDILDSSVSSIREEKSFSFEDLQNLMRGYSNKLSLKNNERRLSLKTKFKGSSHYIFSVCDNDYRKFFSNFGRTKIRVIVNETKVVLQRFRRTNFINNKLNNSINPSQKFIYFPLHFEPERVTLSVTPFYTDQLSIIKNLARSIPIEYKLYVKEHPFQITSSWRPISFYKELLKLPNVVLLHPNFSNEELLKKCSMVIALTGTIGLTAAFYQKPSIVFGKVIYSSLPSVKKISNIEELPDLIRNTLDEKISLTDLNNYANHVFSNSFDFDLYALNMPLLKKYFYDGYLFDVYIPKEDVEKFLKENQNVINELGQQCLKKIKECNNSNLKER